MQANLPFMYGVPPSLPAPYRALPALDSYRRVKANDLSFSLTSAIHKDMSDPVKDCLEELKVGLHRAKKDKKKAWKKLKQARAAVDVRSEKKQALKLRGVLGIAKTFSIETELLRQGTHDSQVDAESEGEAETRQEKQRLVYAKAEVALSTSLLKYKIRR
jgi:hypothetical protein